MEIREVGNLMLQVNADDLKREALEAQRKYREQYASQYTAGYTDCEEKLNPIIDDLTDQVTGLKTEVTGLKTEITDLKSALEKYKAEYGDIK